MSHKAKSLVPMRKNISIDLEIQHLENSTGEYSWQEYDSKRNWRDSGSCSNSSIFIKFQTHILYKQLFSWSDLY